MQDREGEADKSMSDGRNSSDHGVGTARAGIAMFDIYGTLATWRPDRTIIQSRAVAEYGVNVTRAGLDAGYALAEAYMTQVNSATPIRLMSQEERETFFGTFEQKVLDGAGFHVDLDLAKRIWRDVSSQRYELALYPDVAEHLRHLRDSGLVVGVVSNMAVDGRRLSAELGLDGMIDFAVTSGEVGSEKPAPRIFEEALARAGATDATQAVMVGDQPESDLRGAANIGMGAILLDRYRRYTDDEHPDAPRVEDMAGVCQLLVGSCNGRA